MAMSQLEKSALIWILVVQFWISGLFVLSVIFTSIQDIDNLTLCTFISYAIGSFFAGVFSDIYGRKPIFIFSSILLTIASTIIIQYPFYAYVLANLCIGPLNNLTFVYINEVYPQKCQKYTIWVLIGWASSQISLGLFFLVCNVEIFYYLLLIITIFYMLCAVLFVNETDVFQKMKSQIKENNNNNDKRLLQEGPNQTANFFRSLSFIRQKIIPSSLKPLIGGSILMFTMQMFYYRTQFTLDTFGISLQVNTIVVGCTQIVANILFTGILQTLRRKLVLRLLLISLMTLLLFLIFFSQQIVQTIIQGLMRLSDTAIMIILGVYIPQMFPINQKGRGTNFIMSFGVIGSALNGKLFRHLPFWSLQLFLLSALLMTCLLKQTKPLQKINNQSQNKEKMLQKNVNQQISAYSY